MSLETTSTTWKLFGITVWERIETAPAAPPVGSDIGFGFSVTTYDDRSLYNPNAYTVAQHARACDNDSGPVVREHRTGASPSSKETTNV